MKKLLIALVLLALTNTAFAGDPEQDKKFVGLCLGCMTVVPLALFPLGLAFLLFFRALAPRRARLLVLQADSGRVRTFVIGLANVIVLGLLGAAAAHFHAPIVGVLAWLIFVALVCLGSYGLAGALGMRITGDVSVQVKELALGWFVLAYVGCFPIIGWTFALYGACRAIGAGLLALLARDDAPEVA